MRLVYQNDDRLIGVNDSEGLRFFIVSEALLGFAGIGVAVLVDHGEHQGRALLGQHGAQFCRLAGPLHRLSGQLRGGSQLLFQVGTVSDDDDFEGPQHRVGAHGAHQEDHG
ncbi:Uncharacterised protein [Mycobacteroides abscessus subsp. abscessus]|nr:Uncharacterised protein [Mycobacteroides abscessus subsp. abscessus]